MTTPKDGKGNPLEESTEVVGVLPGGAQPYIYSSTAMFQTDPEHRGFAAFLPGIHQEGTGHLLAMLNGPRHARSLKKGGQRGVGTKRKRGAKHKVAALESLLAEIDKRAEEKGAGFNRYSLPGTKKEFQDLLRAYCPDFRYTGLRTLDTDYLKGRAAFQRGTKARLEWGRAIWALFPELGLN